MSRSCCVLPLAVGVLYNTPMRNLEGNILIWLPNWIGDVVMATPLLDALRCQKNTDARLTLIGRPGPVEVLSGDKWDGVIIDQSTGRSKLLSALALRKSIARGSFDLALLLPNSFRTAGITTLAGVKRIVGYARDGRGWLLSDKLKPPTDGTGRFVPVSQIRYFNELGTLVGCPVDNVKMKLPLREEDDARAIEMLESACWDPGRPLVMLNPGAAFGSSKLWPGEYFSALADSLAQSHGTQIIVNAAPGERSIAARVVSSMKTRPLLDFSQIDNTIGLLKGLMKRTTLLVTNDTGARHIGAAMGCAIVTVFGATDPAWTTLDYPRERIVRTNVPCAPCQKKVCRMKGERKGICMRSIEPSQVIAKGRELLEQYGKVQI